MSLLNEVKKLEDAHNRKLQSLERKESKLEEREKELERKEAELKSQEESLEEKIEQNTELVGKILSDEKLKEKASDLEEIQRQVRASRKELTAWENRLYKIEKNQENKEAKLIEDRIQLDEDKKNYKKELKEQFFKELESKVSKL